jgi:hypothetical protein
VRFFSLPPSDLDDFFFFDDAAFFFVDDFALLLPLALLLPVFDWKSLPESEGFARKSTMR